MWEVFQPFLYLGKPLYILPVLFVYTPMLMDGTWPEIVATWISCAFGIVALAAAMEGFAFTKLRGWERLALVGCAVILFVPDYVTDVIGVLLGAAVALHNRKHLRMSAVRD